MKKLSGVLRSYCRTGLGPTKRPSPMSYKLEKGVYKYNFNIFYIF